MLATAPTASFSQKPITIPLFPAIKKVKSV